MAAAFLPIDIAILIADRIPERWAPPLDASPEAQPMWHEQNTQDTYPALAALRLANRMWCRVASPLFFEYLAFYTNHPEHVDKYVQHAAGIWAKLATTLDIDAEDFTSTSRRATKHDIVSFCKMLPLLTSLRTLVFTFPPEHYGFDDRSRLFFEHLLRLPLKLENLTIKFYQPQQHVRSGTDMVPNLIKLCRKTLRSVELIESLVEVSCITALLACPNLKRLAATRTDALILSGEQLTPLPYLNTAMKGLESLVLISSTQLPRLPTLVWSPFIRASQKTLKELKVTDIQLCYAQSAEHDQHRLEVPNVETLAWHPRALADAVRCRQDRIDAPLTKWLIVNADYHSIEVVWNDVQYGHYKQLKKISLAAERATGDKKRAATARRKLEETCEKKGIELAVIYLPDHAQCDCGHDH